MVKTTDNDPLPEDLNPDIRPQDDLYRHVNDKWIKNNSIPEDEPIWSNFNAIRRRTTEQLHGIITDLIDGDDIDNGSIEQKVRDFYLSGIEPETAEASGLEEWQRFDSRIEDLLAAGNLSAAIAHMHRLDIHPFWAVYVDQDESDSSKYLLRLTQSGLSLPDRDYYEQSSQRMRDLKSKLIEHIPAMFETVGSDAPDDAGETVYDLEQRLAGHSWTATKMRDIEASYNKMSFDELCRLAPNIDWREYFKVLGMDPPHELSVDQPDYLRFINSLLDGRHRESLRQYLRWHLLVQSCRYMGDRIAGANFRFFGKQLAGMDEMKPLWERLTLLVDREIGEAIGRLYVKQYFPPEAKQRMEVLVADLKESYSERIQDLQWMSDTTKDTALEKLARTNVKVGYPEKFRNFDQLEITTGSLLGNHWRAAADETEYQLSKLGRPVDRGEWQMPPQMVNAYASFNLSEVVFPAGILQPPFFDPDADDAVNYGGIGAVIGHELTHHFDDQGRRFDTDGNLHNWWSRKDKQAFTARTSVLIEQADGYEALDGHSLNGELTLGENIADVGGTEIAFQALLRALRRQDSRPPQADDSKRRFFLSFARVWRMIARDEYVLQQLLADPHAVGSFRANNPPRNMDSFYEVFDVKPGDGMYLPPEKRFRLW